MGFCIPHLLVVLTIVVLLFGTRRLKDLGGDLGAAIKGFRSAINDQDHDGQTESLIEKSKLEQPEA